jgi:8-oxo-dGTP diphosphatase
LLIKKSKPQWQKGLLNGVGGKIEINETKEYAMVRETFEETGIPTIVTDWERFAEMHFQKAIVYCYRIFISKRLEAVQKTEESLHWIKLKDVRSPAQQFSINNLKWLIPIALTARMNDGIPIIMCHST